MDAAQTYEQIWRDNRWGGRVSRSGRGSDPENAGAAMAAVEWVISRTDAKTVLDVPCGDHGWMRYVPLEDLGVETYLGVDIVRPMIEENRAKFGPSGAWLRSDIRWFSVGDARYEVFGTWDLAVCRDLLIHLPLDEGQQVLANLMASCQWLLAGTWDNPVNRSWGWRAINLMVEPFNLAPPEVLFVEAQRGKALGLWRGRAVNR